MRIATISSQGNPTEVMLGLKGVDDDGFVAFEEQMREHFSGLKGFHRVPMVQLPIDGALEVIRLKENHKEMQFQEWMATLQSLVLAGIYRVSVRRAELQSGGGEGGISLPRTRWNTWKRVRRRASGFTARLLNSTSRSWCR